MGMSVGLAVGQILSTIKLETSTANPRLDAACRIGLQLSPEGAVLCQPRAERSVALGNGIQNW